MYQTKEKLLLLCKRRKYVLDTRWLVVFSDRKFEEQTTSTVLKDCNESYWIRSASSVSLSLVMYDSICFCSCGSVHWLQLLADRLILTLVAIWESGLNYFKTVTCFAMELCTRLPWCEDILDLHVPPSAALWALWYTPALVAIWQFLNWNTNKILHAVILCNRLPWSEDVKRPIFVELSSQYTLALIMVIWEYLDWTTSKILHVLQLYVYNRFAMKWRCSRPFFVGTAHHLLGYESFDTHLCWYAIFVN